MNKRRKIDADQEAFMLANAKDMTIQDFADAFDLSRSCIWKFGKKLGVTFKNGCEVRRMSNYDAFERARKVPAYGGKRAMVRPPCEYSNIRSNYLNG